MSLSVEKFLQAWTNSLRQMNAKADTVFFGDSLTYYGDFASVFPDKVVCNLGLRGDTLQGMIDRVEQVKLLDPKVVYLMAGINDVGYRAVEEFVSLYASLIDNLFRELPGISLVIQSLLPVNSVDFKISCDNNQIRLVNLRIKEIAMKRGLKFVDLYSLYENNGQLPSAFTKDGIHLTQHAYNIWYNGIR